MDQNFHRSDDLLEDYLLSRLSDSDLPALEEHLMVCDACRDRLDTLEGFTLGLREVHASQPVLGNAVSPKTDWFGWMRRPAFSLAVALVAVVAAVAVFSARETALAPVAALQLTATRGEMPVISPAGELDLTFSDAPRQSEALRVEVVDATGGAVWNGLAQSTAAGVQVKAQRRLGPGEYFVRLYSTSGQLLHEYGFRVR